MSEPSARATGRPMPLSPDRRLLLFLGVGSVLLVITAVLALGVGTVPLSPREVIEALTGAGHPADQHIVRGLRAPRILLALLAGAMLSLAGALLQTTGRNDLADPSLLGLTSSAALLVVGVGVVVGAPSTSLLATGAGVLGAALAAAVTLWLARGEGGARLLLYGVVVGAVCSAALSVLLSLRGSVLAEVMRWIIGSLAASTWAEVRTTVLFTVAGLVLSIAAARPAVLLWVGAEHARALGTQPGRTQLWTLAAVVLLVAGAAAAIGAMAFVGLVGPHLARRIVGAHPARVLPASALTGAGLLLGADVLAQLASCIPLGEVTARTALPTGAVTAVLGGPFLLALLLRGENAAR